MVILSGSVFYYSEDSYVPQIKTCLLTRKEDN